VIVIPAQAGIQKPRQSLSALVDIATELTEGHRKNIKVFTLRPLCTLW